jgi:sigma-E factor negative regulatory protein RseA
MADEKKEWISALADGELTGNELKRSLDALRDEPALLESWSRYHLVRDALHSNLEAQVMPDLSERVAAALDSEPVILAPKRTLHPWLRHAAGLAVAASVTGVAILGINGMNEEGEGPTAVAANQPQEYRRMEQPVAKAQVPDGEHLAPYLVNHNEYAVSSGMHGMLPYVRIVGHKAGE